MGGLALPPRHSRLAVALTLLAAALPATAQQPHADAAGQITFALTGDAIITRRLSVFEEPEFLRMRQLMLDADVAYTNLEILLHDYGPDVIPAAASGGTYMRADPAMAKELAWLGVDMVSAANNHTMDFGVGGLRATLRAAEAAGLVHAGAGENLAEARAPGYLESPAGRVAIISVASTFNDAMRAGAQRKDMRGRPGLSPIRYRTTYHVPAEALEALREVKDSLGLGGQSGDDAISMMGNRFVSADVWGRETHPHPDDLAEIEAVIRDAKRQANWVVLSSHSHEGMPGRRDVPAQFVEEFAHAAIDAGADIFLAHGPHVLRGMEIYKGKPIFYSLSNFVFQNETVEIQPADNYEGLGLDAASLPSDFYDRRNERPNAFPNDPLFWESVIAHVGFTDGELSHVELHPITLGHGLPRPQRGRPLMATGALADKIVGDMQRLSEPYGTAIENRNGVGFVRLGPGGDR